MKRMVIWMSAVSAALLLLTGCVSAQPGGSEWSDPLTLPADTTAIGTTTTADTVTTAIGMTTTPSETEREEVFPLLLTGIRTTKAPTKTDDVPCTPQTTDTFAAASAAYVMRTEKAIYRPDETVRLYVRDMVNGGCAIYRGDYELWEQSGDGWVRRYRCTGYPSERRWVFHSGSGEDFYDITDTVDLSTFAEVKAGRNYRLVMHVWVPPERNHHLLTADFKTTAQGTDQTVYVGHVDTDDGTGMTIEYWDGT